MRREKVFSKGGFYGFMVDSNLLLHQEAMASGLEAIQTLPGVARPTRPVRVLDLACGGQPISIANMMENCPGVDFHYTGVDINPDQVEKARDEFVFPSNVTKKDIFEGDAWNLEHLGSKQFDIIFIGMNLHHGTPKECLFLMRQVRQLLADHGLFINHDSYRPCEEPFKKRPKMNPGNSTESLNLVDRDLLLSCSIADTFINIGTPIDDDDDGSYDWRLKFTEELQAAMLSRGADPEQTASVIKHILERDYSLSTAEMQAIAGAAFLQTEIVEYSTSTAPMKDYYRMLIFREAA